MRPKRLSLEERQEIFYALVSTQDTGVMSVSQSRQHVTKRFSISESQLRQIEEEGLDNQWPPLDVDVAWVVCDSLRKRGQDP